jgi:hypothetical protein
MKTGFEWVVPPEKLAEAIGAYELRCRVALYAAANAWGQKNQDDARLSAGWEDRTGAARSGLFFAVDGFGMGMVQGEVEGDAKALMSDTAVVQGDENTLIITLAHTVFYGKYLELSNGGRYAIILSTLERNLPELEKLIQQSYGH